MPRMLTYLQKQSHILPDHMAIVGAHMCVRMVYGCACIAIKRSVSSMVAHINVDISEGSKDLDKLTNVCVCMSSTINKV